ncbi:hypothetical protein GGD68_007356 [Paraburkholderia fungorum]|uniref:ATP-grasp domain-containing protein n=1 Tax=Paraburkholderia fungorum TaxID=134537 RepID=UPI00182B49C1|nr:ATP-grasp domain-containing protein [Paraburkholderia fungorum]MBB4518548.1 hypothetical protein [Paraburkholderia fungorum]
MDLLTVLLKSTVVTVSLPGAPLDPLDEWRAYVAGGQLLDICLADHGGDVNAMPDQMIIEDAVQPLTAQRGTPAGYVIDFGVLETGETALIEMNDGFSIGAYAGVSPDAYWAVTVSRWAESDQKKR